MMSTWKELIEEAMVARGETLADLVSNTLTSEEMAIEFYNDFGSEPAKPFTAWTNNNVYFPLSYDGAQSVGSVSRHPDGKPTEHQGNGR